MKKYALFAAFLCLVSLFACNKDIQTENVAENIKESKAEYVYEPLTYTLVEPTQAELEKIRNKLGIISATIIGDYDCETNNAYQHLFHWNELEYFYIPPYDEEIAKYISEPVRISEYGIEFWDKTFYEKDPLGRFGDLSPKIFDEDGIFDEDLYYEYCKETGKLETAGYNEYNGAYIDWLVEGVWNGKIDHNTFFEFDDTTQLYYHDGNYYSRRTEGGRGGGVFFNPVLYEVVELDDYKYEAHFVNMDDSDKPAYYTTMVIGMKQASNGFRFWSIYSIDEEIIKNTEREPITYTPTEPTQQELDQIHEKLDIVLSTFFEDYDSNTDNAYEKLFEYNELNYFYIPEYEGEIIKYIAKPYYTRHDGVNAWHVIIDNRDPQLEFGEIPKEILDKRGMLDMDLYSEYSDKIGDDFGFTLSGYYTYDANFVDWLIEGVWNGKVDHETVFEFSDKEMLYYCHYNDNYYTRRFEMGRGGGVFYRTKILEMTELDGYKYELKLDVINDLGDHDHFATAVVGMKESSNGFRFWSIYSINHK